jgi:TPR repeat protein
MCFGPAVGSFGQVELGSSGDRPAPPPSYPIPATPPPAGVAPAQQAQADQIWNRAVDLLDRNDAWNAMPLLYQCAVMGDKRCEATLGIRYQDGDGIKADDHAAAYWFGLAVAQGHRASQYALAGMYQEGEGGLPHDDRKATELMIKSANQGYFKAQYALAFQYEIGDGVPRDRQKAIELFRASGDGIAIADALADPKAPARFTDMIAFARYLSGLRNAEEAASWQQWLNTLPKGGGGCDGACALQRFKMDVWRGQGGIDSGKPRPN